MEVFRHDVKTGLFLLIALGLFCFGVFEAGGFLERLRPGRQITIVVENALRVTPGVEVVYLGKKVGAVSAIDFSEQGDKVHIICSVDPEMKIFSGTMARIEDKSALGGKLIELYPPQTDKDTWALLGENESIEGMPASSLSALISNLNETVSQLRVSADTLLDKAGGLLEELDLAVSNTAKRFKRLSDLAPVINETLVEYQALATSLNSQVETLGGKLDGGLDNILPATRETIEEYKKLAVKLEEEIGALKSELSATLNKTNSLMGSTEQVVLDNREELSRTLQLMTETLQSLEVFSERIGERPSAIIFSKKKELDEDDE